MPLFTAPVKSLPTTRRVAVTTVPPEEFVLLLMMAPSLPVPLATLAAVAVRTSFEGKPSKSVGTMARDPPGKADSYEMISPWYASKGRESPPINLATIFPPLLITFKPPFTVRDK